MGSSSSRPQQYRNPFHADFDSDDEDDEMVPLNDEPDLEEFAYEAMQSKPGTRPAPIHLPASAPFPARLSSPITFDTIHRGIKRQSTESDEEEDEGGIRDMEGRDRKKVKEKEPTREYVVIDDSDEDEGTKAEVKQPRRATLARKAGWSYDQVNT